MKYNDKNHQYIEVLVDRGASNSTIYKSSTIDNKYTKDNTIVWLTTACKIISSLKY